MRLPVHFALLLYMYQDHQANDLLIANKLVAILTTCTYLYHTIKLFPTLFDAGTKPWQTKLPSVQQLICSIRVYTEIQLCGNEAGTVVTILTDCVILVCHSII